MPTSLCIGCCGWSYLDKREFPGRMKRKCSSKLQAYAQLFDAVEINSSFYGIPRPPTAQKWRDEARTINPTFTFTVKAYQGITHVHRFKGESIALFRQLKEVCRAVDSHVILFQSPASFRPTETSLEAMRSFFRAIDRDGLICVWEPRGRWYDTPPLIAEVCRDCGLVHCVDPLRNEPLAFGDEQIAYFRLHGFGRPGMYRYDFSEDELKQIAAIIRALPRALRKVYVFFNNVFCYSNALEFWGMCTAGLGSDTS